MCSLTATLAALVVSDADIEPNGPAIIAGVAKTRKRRAICTRKVGAMSMHV